MPDLPVVVIGAGPQGLAAAAHLAERDQSVLVLERGAAAGAAVAEWGHVRLFSAWPELIDAAARRLLEASGWTAPAGGYPTGAEWAARYLLPLAAALGERVRTGVAVTGVAREGRDRVVSSGRDDAPFVVHARTAAGEERILARAVVDASGTWSQPRPAGANGLPAIGEAGAADAVSYRIPSDADRFAGRHVAVVGAGHSATQAVLALDAVAAHSPETRITWIVRRDSPTNLFGGGAADDLPERAALGVRAHAAIDRGRVRLVTGYRLAEIRREQAAVTLVAEDGRRIPDVDHVIALTGFRPDTTFLSELRLDLDPVLEAVAGIAGEIDPNLHSCGSVGATGARQLAQPERDLFVVGAKSYGRAPTFLALTGYEQVRSVAAHLAGDHEAAARSELVLPETGVCGGAGDFGGSACCAPPVLQIGR